MYRFSLILLFIICIGRAQVVIGSSNVTPAAMLKLDSNVKALRIPALSITAKTDALTPIPSPANGLMLYNTNSNIPNEIGKSLAYWGSDNQYHFQGTQNIINSMVDRSPILVFSAKIGQKPPFSTAVPKPVVSLTSSEILKDTYGGWSANKYTISKAGIYTMEFVAELYDNSGSARWGQTHIELTPNISPNFFEACVASFVPLLGRACPSSILVYNLPANTRIEFKYVTNVLNSSRLNSGTINIYKH